ncbi:hypothetical protein C1646_760496 [Rhizophagus diaphanus]|nr:hypothetical protein C1646_760496 [Rhizophagus diaphanus] [Rhizophagus sp. MUCL 43196]
MKQFQNLKIIFKYVDYLLSLTLICLNCLSVVKGNTHALFYKIAALPLMHFGKNYQLVNRIRSIQQKFKSSFINNIPLDEGYKAKIRDMALFHADYHVINHVNIENILTALPKLFQLDLNNDGFHINQLSKNGYKNKTFLSLSMEHCFQTTPLTVFRLSINVGTSRYINQRRHTSYIGRLRRQRNINRIYRRYQRNASANNEDTMNRIMNLPPQITNDQSIYQFFNGFSFT